MRFASVLAFVPLVGVAHAQSSPNLADYLQRHPLDAKGPVIAVEPERVKPTGSGTSLAAFGRKAAAVGDATFVVPVTRVDIDDSLDREPNLYEGLPADKKLVYLMRSFTDEQWKKVASEKGIGRGDLMGEQRLVFDSLVPKPFAWTAVKVGRNHSMSNEVKRGTLSDNERQQIRVRLSRTVDLHVYLANVPNSMSSLGSERYRGKEGEWSYQRDLGQEYRSASAFGLDFRKEVPNRPKASQLDYRSEALRATVTLPAKSTVGELVAKAGKAAGLEIIPDFRVGERVVTTTGGEVRAASLLQGLAYAITGTYRKLGPAYVLTSDLTGLGSRKYRIATWQRALEVEAEKRAAEWMTAIGKTPGFSRVDFPPSLGLTSELSDAIENAYQGRRIPDISASALSPMLKGLLDQWDVEYRTQPINKDKVQLTSRYKGQFILPNGIGLAPDIDAGFPFQYRKIVTQSAAGVPTRSFPQATVDKQTGLTFFVTTEEPGAVAALIAPFRAYPTERLWIETHSSEVLKKAVELTAGTDIKIGLAIRPWRAATRTPDVNIGGLRGDAVNQQLESISRTQLLAKTDPVPLWMSPDDPNRGEAWRRYGELAKTPGIQGVLLLETQPYGYEKARERWFSMLEPLSFAVLAHGYTPEARLAFLRKESIDPIDIGDEAYWTTPDLRQPFFFDDGLRGMPSLYDGTDDTHPKMSAILQVWREFLAARQLRATRELLDLLSSQPISMELRLANLNQASQRPGYVVPWKPGADLPLTPSDLNAEPEYEEMQRLTLMLAPADLAEYGRGRGHILPYYGNARSGHPLNLILGFLSSDPDKIASVLSVWFKPSGTP